MKFALCTTPNGIRGLFPARKDNECKTVEFEPTELVAFYTWNDEGEIFIDEERKANILQKQADTDARFERERQEHLQSPTYKIAQLKKQQQALESQIVAAQAHDLLVSRGLITDSTESDLDKLLITNQLLKDTASGGVTAFASIATPAFQSAVLEVPTDLAQEWTVGTAYKKGQIVNYKGVKYLLMNNVTAQAHQPPDMANGVMLAVYKPYRDSKPYPWLYGEYCLKGFKREYGGKWYEVIQADAGANIYSPNQVPAVWKETTA